MKPALLIVLTSLGLLSACAATLQTRSDYDKSQDFSGYRTFAWIANDPVIAPVGEVSPVSPLNRRRIVEAVETELAGKGYRQVADRGSADFVLAFTVGARDRIDVNSFPEPYRAHWSWGWPYFGTRADVRTYREGVLAIDIFDGKTRSPVWHGRASKRITQSDVENAATQIPLAVKAILAQFPPH
jgi:hypothetical protein